MILGRVKPISSTEGAVFLDTVTMPTGGTRRSSPPGSAYRMGGAFAPTSGSSVRSAAWPISMAAWSTSAPTTTSTAYPCRLSGSDPYSPHPYLVRTST